MVILSSSGPGITFIVTRRGTGAGRVLVARFSGGLPDVRLVPGHLGTVAARWVGSTGLHVGGFIPHAWFAGVWLSGTRLVCVGSLDTRLTRVETIGVGGSRALARRRRFGLGMPSWA